MKEVINVLLIEDDRQDVELIRSMLLTQGTRKFKLIHTDRLHDGIHLAKEGDINVILTDLGLPDSFGLNSFIKLDAAVPEIPIIVLTGLSDETMGNEAVRMGAQDYLLKGEIHGDTLKRSLAYGIERKKAKEIIRESERKYMRLSHQLKEMNDLKELLLDVITHDLKNLAGAINSCNQMLFESDPSNDIINTSLKSSKKLLDIIDNTYTLSKVTSGEDINKPDLDLKILMEEVLEEFDNPFKNTGFKVELKVSGSLLVKANEIISEIFKNYISNALKYASEGTRLVIEGVRNGDLVTLKFIDWGYTIPEDMRESIFMREVQLGSVKNEGYGLGLAIVKRIAEAHNGQVWVEPNEPRGNKFCLSLSSKLNGK